MKHTTHRHAAWKTLSLENIRLVLAKREQGKITRHEVLPVM